MPVHPDPSLRLRELCRFQQRRGGHPEPGRYPQQRQDRCVAFAAFEHPDVVARMLARSPSSSWVSPSSMRRRRTSAPSASRAGSSWRRRTQRTLPTCKPISPHYECYFAAPGRRVSAMSEEPRRVEVELERVSYHRSARPSARPPGPRARRSDPIGMLDRDQDLARAHRRILRSSAPRRETRARRGIRTDRAP